MSRREQRMPDHHPSADLGVKVDITHIGEVLELLDERTAELDEPSAVSAYRTPPHSPG